MVEHLLYENFACFNFEFSVSKDNNKSFFANQKQYCLQVLCQPHNEQYSIGFFVYMSAEDDKLPQNYEYLEMYVSVPQKKMFGMVNEMGCNNTYYLYNADKKFDKGTYSGKLLYKLNFDKNCFNMKMHKLLTDQKYSDLVIIADKTRFNVHKNIVANRSNVLAKIIDSNMQENLMNQITLHGYNKDIVYELLKFIYTNICDLDREPIQLFKLAHFLDIAELQNLCKQYLILNITRENMLEIFKIAIQSQYQLEDLKIAAIDFVYKNRNILQVKECKQFFRENFDLFVDMFVKATFPGD